MKEQRIEKQSRHKKRNRDWHRDRKDKRKTKQLMQSMFYNVNNLRKDK
jgi:hypothetical protein